jgi:hypothetical protein
MRVLFTLAGYMGAACLVVAPWVIDSPEGKLAAMSGLALLTIQAVDLKAWNLIILNLAGIAGYYFAYLG